MLHLEKATKDNLQLRSTVYLHQVLQEHQDEVWFVQFSNNGKYLASASNDKSAIIWKVINIGVPILSAFIPTLCRLLLCNQQHDYILTYPHFMFD